jgi:hypothetical protein
MIVAKLPFLLSDWEGLLSGTAWLSHGKTIMCGIVGGYFGIEVAKWALDIRVKTGDTFAAPVAVRSRSLPDSFEQSDGSSRHQHLQSLPTAI